MHEEDISMTFDRKVFVRGCEKHFFCNSEHFIHKSHLILSIPDVLYYSITENPVKFVGLEWKHAPFILNKLFARKNLTHRRQVVNTQPRVVLTRKSEIL